MAKEEKLLQVQSKLNDRDFEDVYRIFLDTERGKDRKIAMISCGVIAAICILLLILWKNITFLFYAIGACIVGYMYLKMPVNKKFIATNKLHFGERRLTTFYPHSISTMELLQDGESLDEEEVEEATTTVSTVSLKAYENERGFLFAEGKIVSLFLYVPKRNLSDNEINAIRDFAEERCSGGYQLLEMKSIIEDAHENDDDSAETGMTNAVCEQYYGAKKLRLYDADGQRVRMDDEEEDFDMAEEEQPETDSLEEDDIDKFPEDIADE
ncbi:MAG: hypothetical protein MJ071_04665 [Oscillospiraceae bacterium]|nr:hypothetical protein [Oscillospiraceae bacterium]